MVLTLDIHRGDAVAQGTDSFTVDAHDRMTLLDALVEIQTQHDPTLAFRYACRVGMCGSCAVVVNGKERWGCRTRLATLGTDRVTVRPLYHFPIVRDLVVDMTPFVDRMNRVGGLFVPAANHGSLAVIKPHGRKRRRIDAGIECIGCGACLSACAFVGAAPRFPGPAPLLRAFTLMEDTRDGAREDRLAGLVSADALSACHGHMNCVEVCPMDLSPTDAISALKRLAVGSLIGLWRPTSEREVIE
jgi:fumarate reductase iron-sulfur subunit